MLMRRISRFREIQAIYMPIVPRRLAGTESENGVPPENIPSSSTGLSTSGLTDSEHPPTSPAWPSPVTLALPQPSDKSSVELAENAPLLLPSAILKAARDDGPSNNPDEAAQRQRRRAKLREGFAVGLDALELQLRAAQCADSLEDIRTKLYMRTRLRQYKRVNVRNQHRNSRANDALSGVETRLQRAVDKYRVARDTLMSLVGTYEDWRDGYAAKYRELRPEDVRAFDADDPETARKKKRMRKAPEKQIAEGSRKTSWIWHGSGESDSEGITAGTPLSYDPNVSRLNEFRRCPRGMDEGPRKMQTLARRTQTTPGRNTPNNCISYLEGRLVDHASKATRRRQYCPAGRTHGIRKPPGSSTPRPRRASGQHVEEDLQCCI